MPSPSRNSIMLAKLTDHLSYVQLNPATSKSLISSDEKGPPIPIAVHTSIASHSNSVACVEIRRLFDCNFVKTGLMSYVNTLIPCMIIHYQLGGATRVGFVELLMYSNNWTRLRRSHAQTFPMTSHRVDSCGQVACISVINATCCLKCAMNFFIISTTSLSHNSLYVK